MKLVFQSAGGLLTAVSWSIWSEVTNSSKRTKAFSSVEQEPPVCIATQSLVLSLMA